MPVRRSEVLGARRRLAARDVDARLRAAGCATCLPILCFDSQTAVPAKADRLRNVWKETLAGRALYVGARELDDEPSASLWTLPGRVHDVRAMCIQLSDGRGYLIISTRERC
jgi:hypothetical protein